MGDPQIVTVGTGWHEQLADRAEIDVSFAATSKDRASAVRDLGRAVAVVEPVLAKAGVEVRGRRLHVGTEWRGRKQSGARASEDIALRITDLTVLEDVLGALLSAEPASLDGPRWTLADPAAALVAAQHNAVADARTRAEGYAGALGAALGALVQLTEADHSGPAPMVMRAAAFDAAARGQVDVTELGLEPEPVRVSARCTTTWALTTPQP
ncbi:SIMPL domain-containing protein [Pseudonocardia benzenivorans]|uniref:SIMPL domain-containing protein n=1 Tax=Pseudonocardia benzenivorans TaxID=228005 RepID=A0ABW3VFU9_9PSEU